MPGSGWNCKGILKNYCHINGLGREHYWPNNHPFLQILLHVCTTMHPNNDVLLRTRIHKGGGYISQPLRISDLPAIGTLFIKLHNSNTPRTLPAEEWSPWHTFWEQIRTYLQEMLQQLLPITLTSSTYVPFILELHHLISCFLGAKVSPRYLGLLVTTTSPRRSIERCCWHPLCNHHYYTCTVHNI